MPVLVKAERKIIHQRFILDELFDICYKGQPKGIFFSIPPKRKKNNNNLIIVISQNLSEKKFLEGKARVFYFPF